MQVLPAPALPCGFEAEVPPVSQILTISNAMCLPRVRPALGLGIPNRSESLCITTVKPAIS